MKITKEKIRGISISHQRQMSSVHPHAIIGTIEDAINEALVIANVSNKRELLLAFESYLQEEYGESIVGDAVDEFMKHIGKQ